MDNKNVYVTIPVDYVCIPQSKYEAMLIEISKNQELFDNIVGALQGERDWADIRPIRAMLGMTELPEEE